MALPCLDQFLYFVGAARERLRVDVVAMFGIVEMVDRAGILLKILV
jgi:hypothetical protein